MSRKSLIKSDSSDNSKDSVSRGLGAVVSYRGNLTVFLVLFGVGLFLDLWSKSYVFSHFYDPVSDYQGVAWWVEGIFGIQPSTNPGALFGFGAGYHRLFASASVLFLSFILAWFLGWGGIRDRWLTICFGMISAGIVGNLYDRLGLGWGFGLPEICRFHVRDWILFRLEGIPGFDPWPNFNIADSLLVMGALLLFWHGFRMSPDHKTPNKFEANV